MKALLEIVKEDNKAEFDKYIKDKDYIDFLKKRPSNSWNGFSEIPLNVILFNIPKGLTNYYYFIKRLIDCGAFFEIKEPYSSIEGYHIVKDKFKTNFVYEVCKEMLKKKKVFNFSQESYIK